MSATYEEKNKALVLEAFDTLFNKRDYAAAERYWSPHYIHTARTSRLAARVCSISSRVSRQR
jgi:predicted SnoaL-like aldol condensation-catalyzing enzyme